MAQYTVHGYVNQVAYALRVDTEAPDESDDGLVTFCSPPTALARLILNRGEQAPVSESGPAYEVNLSSPEGILAGLYAYTEVVRVEGDAPDLFKGAETGTHIDY